MVFVWKKYMDFLGKITRKDFVRRIVRGGKKGIFFVDIWSDNHCHSS